MLEKTALFFVYLGATALITYLVRMLPLVFFRKKIENRFVRSFLYYVPYSVLTVMTVPDIFFSTGSVISAAVGTAVAIALAAMKKSLLAVSAGAAAAVLATEIIIGFL